MQYKPTPTELPKASGDRVQQVKDFLSEHYEIKINEFDSSKSFIVAKDKKRYTSEVLLSDISLHMESEGIRGCDSILKKIIASPNQVMTFNPITEYIESLENAWRGESHIDKLCKHIIARDFGDREVGYYQERFRRLLKKWMAASLACSLGIKANDAMLGFVHSEEGIGKTNALEFLVPKALKGYYIKSDKEERYFDLPSAFTRNFMVNFDEFVGITKSTADAVKGALSSLHFTMSRTFTRSVQRIGNGVFTSNRTKELGGFLLPSMGARRWAIVELESIDWRAYTKEVDVDQMWAEAYVLFKNADFDYAWNEIDFEEFKLYNARYLKETTAYRLINEWYRLPNETDSAETIQFKQPMEILADLRNARKLKSNMIDVSEVTIGLALKAHGYERIAKKLNKISPRYGYNVVPLFGEQLPKKEEKVFSDEELNLYEAKIMLEAENN